MENYILNKEHFDVAVIGGGAAGMMAAISAGRNGAKVVLIEKNKSLGKKLLLTGNGRCNITQAAFTNREFVQKLGPNGKFLFSSISKFGPRETKEFFESLGIILKTEKDGRVFPESDKAQDVLDALVGALKKNGVKIIFDQNVTDLAIKDKKIEYVASSDKKIYADNFIISTGGKSYPATGSTGDGYSWLENIGHKINSPAPALVPITIVEPWVKKMKGVSLKDVRVNLLEKNRKIKLGSGEILFTHFGLSGPAIINASKIIGEHLKNGKVTLALDLFPTLDPAALEEKLKTDFGKFKEKNLKTYLSEIFPQKLSAALMELSGINKDRKIHSVTRLERTTIARLMKGVEVTAGSVMDFNHSMVTSGGADLKQIDPKTMRSKIISNLFLAGEVLDLDGPTGGYNLQIAWTTGYIAGSFYPPAL